jgi:hypothetical protein
LIKEFQLLCPSGRCKKDSILLGIVQPEGNVSIAKEKIFINESFIKIAKLGRTPEKRFRFAETCVTSACKQWTNGKCGVISKAIQIVIDEDKKSQLPECAIRAECRWYHQQGNDACFICPMIVTTRD